MELNNHLELSPFCEWKLFKCILKITAGGPGSVLADIRGKGNSLTVDDSLANTLRHVLPLHGEERANMLLIFWQ